MDRPRFPSIIMWKKNIKFELLQDYISNKIKLENFMNQYNLKDKINKII